MPAETCQETFPVIGTFGTLSLLFLWNISFSQTNKQFTADRYVARESQTRRLKHSY